MAFYELDPFGEERADLRTGILAATIANGFTHGRGNFTARDFMPFAEKPRQDIEAMQAILMMASQHGAAAAESRAAAKPPSKKKR